jgi:alkanesulfonate monooxygenase SsuD/methylene tetrahydromethanopterin reductase-like flavin-dependent oxidoreductase (luciferase family)
MPIDGMLIGGDGKPDVAGGIASFRAALAEFGRDPSQVPISLLMFSRPSEARVLRYAALGVQRLVISSPSAELVTEDFTRRHLDEVTPLVERFNA